MSNEKTKMSDLAETLFAICNPHKVTINTIADEVAIKRDLLLDQMADDYFMKIKIHSEHSTHERLKTELIILMLDFYQEMKALENAGKDKLSQSYVTNV